MRHNTRQAGFTLIEVSLAIVIGITLLAGAIVLYQQTSMSAKNSAAKEKLMALSIVVEEVDLRNYALPSIGQLREAWKSRRPSDYNTSPWGGSFSDPETRFIDGNDVVAPGQEIGQGVNGTALASASVSDTGRAYYFRRNPAAPGRPYIWINELSTYGSEDPLAVNRVFGYGVAYIGPDGRQFYFVQGRQKTNQAGGPSAMDGQITN